MNRALAKARAALLTDPVTGLPLSAGERASLAIGLAVAVAVLAAMLVLGLGLGGGQ